VPPRAGQAKATSPAAPDPIAFSPPSHHPPPWCCDDHLNPPCGFLSLFQAEIAAHVGVPVATSSLLQVPWVQATLPPGKRVGLLTVCASTLTPAHLAAADALADIPVAGTENGREFFRVLVRAEKDDLDVDAAERDILDAGRDLVSRHPEVGAIVLECTNMPPYAAALREAVGLPVFDIYSMVTWFHAGLRPRAFPGG
jgi:hypothetical protein